MILKDFDYSFNMSSFGDGVRTYKQLLRLEHEAAAIKEGVDRYNSRFSGDVAGGRSFEDYLSMWEKDLPGYQRDARRLKRLAGRVAKEAERHGDREARKIAERAAETKTNIDHAQRYMFIPKSRDDWVQRVDALTK